MSDKIYEQAWLDGYRWAKYEQTGRSVEQTPQPPPATPTAASTLRQYRGETPIRCGG